MVSGMDVVHGLPRPVAPPESSPSRALEDIRFIRRCMESAGAFTAVPGLGTMIVGATALVAAVVASYQTHPMAWVKVWLVAAAVAMPIGFVMLQRKARAAGTPLFSGPGRRFALSLLPPLIAAAIVSGALVQAGVFRPVPGVWLLLYGTAVVTGGAFSVRVVTLMGLSFMVLGGVALFFADAKDLLMGAGFGGLHLIFGWVIRERHGG